MKVDVLTGVGAGRHLADPVHGAQDVQHAGPRARQAIDAQKVSRRRRRRPRRRVGGGAGAARARVARARRRRPVLVLTCRETRGIIDLRAHTDE